MRGRAVLRVVLAVISCALLAGCWVSERDLFNSSDWARLDIEGEYEIESPADFGGAGHRVLISSRDDGLIEIAADGWGEEDESQLMGLVPIPGGSGRFFLAVDLSSSGGEAAFYYIAHLTFENGLALHYPDCTGTDARDGLVFEDGGKGGPFCSFSTREALFDAALEAERFLAARHIVAVMPMYSLRKVEADPGPEEFEPE